MGQLLADALRKAAESSGKQLKDLVTPTGLQMSRLSEYQNNKRTPSFECLAQLADGYGLPYRDIVRLWLLDQAESTSAKDRLSAEVFPNQELPALNDIDALVRSLGGARDVQKAARTVIDNLEKSKSLLDVGARKIIDTLARIPQLNVVGGRTSKSVCQKDVQWSPLRAGSKVAKCTVFVATKPTPMLAELHSFAARTGGIHRQPEFPTNPACYELWCLVSGNGLLLICEDDAWQDYSVADGSCGYYWSANRHIWMNLSRDAPLIIFHAFFPYRRSDLDPSGPGEALEFSLDSFENSLPNDIAAVIRGALRQQRQRPSRVSQDANPDSLITKSEAGASPRPG